MTMTLNPGILGQLVRCFAVVAALWLLTPTSELVQAAPVTYTINANGTGSLGGTAFSDSDFVITAYADTEDVVPFGQGFTVANFNINISVVGIGNGDLANANTSSSNRFTNLAGFGDIDQDLAILAVSNPIFGSYDLKSSIGPIAGPPVKSFGSYPTTAGLFVMNSVTSASFTAVVVPEPSTSALFLAATLFFVACRRSANNVWLHGPAIAGSPA